MRQPDPNDPEPDPSFPSDFLALECKPRFGLNVDEGDSRDSTLAEGVPDSPDSVRRQAHASVHVTRRQLACAPTDVEKFGDSGTAYV